MKSVMIILSVAVAMGQTVPGSVAGDPFIGSIRNMKRSVVPVVCLAVNGTETSIVRRTGNAFFTSGAGDFLTAAHVILNLKGEHSCQVPAVIMPVANWHPEDLDENQVSFPFRISDCRIDKDLDVAACSLIDDPRSAERPFKISSVSLEPSVPPDGTQVALTGFPDGFRDPLTSRAGVAAYRRVWRNQKAVSELVLDRVVGLGTSGSPAYLSDGRVVGIVIGIEEATGMTVLRPAAIIREIFAERLKR
jgi:hypothetical protein